MAMLKVRMLLMLRVLLALIVSTACAGTIGPSHVDHQGPHHVVRVGRCCCCCGCGRCSVIDRRGHGRAEAVDGPIGRVQCLDIVKVVGHRTHLDHALAVVGCKALDFRATIWLEGLQLGCDSRQKTYRFWNHTCTWRGLKPGI